MYPRVVILFINLQTENNLLYTKDNNLVGMTTLTLQQE